MGSALCCASHLACAIINTFNMFSSTSLNFSPLLHSQGIRLHSMFDPQVVLAAFLVGWVECGVAAMQSQFAGVSSGWNSSPCNIVPQYRQESLDHLSNNKLFVTNYVSSSVLPCSWTKWTLSSVYYCPGYLSLTASAMQRNPIFYPTHRHDNTFVCCCLSFYSSKAEETTLLYFSPMSPRTLCSCSALRSFKLQLLHFL